MTVSLPELSELSLEQKLGLMIWAPFMGYRSWSARDSFQLELEMVRKGLIGGFIVREGELYETATLINRLQKAAPLPLVIGADIENGLGSLLPGGTVFPANMAFGATRSGEYSYLAGKIIAQEASALGINLILGPTSCRPGAGLPEGMRPVSSFGEKLHLVAKMVAAYIQGVRKSKLIAAPRYFPGADVICRGEYTGASWLHYLRKLLLDTELGVYETLIQRGLAAVIVDWREIPDLSTGQRIPAMCSRNLLEVLLREVLGFEGVVITRDLYEPVEKKTLDPSVFVDAVNAGVDVLVGMPDASSAQKILFDAVRNEKISLARVDQAAGRVLALKRHLAPLKPGDIRTEEIDNQVASPANLEVADRIAEDSITLLRDKRVMLPLVPGENRQLLNLLVTARFDADKEKLLDEALRRHLDRVVTHQIDTKVSTATLNEAWQEAHSSDMVILCSMFTNQAPDYSVHGFSPTQVEFIRRLINSRTPLIMASFGDPRCIALFPEVECYLCLYSDTPSSQQALVRDLFGELIMPVKGKLPVTLDCQHPYGFGLDLNR